MISEDVKYEAIVIGASAGGIYALKNIFTGLKKSFSIPILIVQHVSVRSEGFIAYFLNQLTNLEVKEAVGGERIEKGKGFIAPANFHMLVEEDKTISLNVEEKVNYARPSIDVLFETAALAFKSKLVGVLLTGANSDGAEGMALIKKMGGLTIAQNPQTSEISVMPQSAINLGCVDKVLDLENVVDLLNSLPDS